MWLHLGADSRNHLVLLFLVGICQVAAAITVMNGVHNLFNHLITADSGSLADWSIWPTLLMMAAGFLALAWLRGFERVAAEKLGQHSIASLRLRLFNHLSHLPTDKAHKLSRGGLLMRFTGDLNALRTWISLGIARLLVTGIFISITILWLATINIIIASAVTLTVSLGFFISWYLGNTLCQRAREARSKRAALTSNIAEKSSTLPVMQVFAQQYRENRRVKRQSDALVEAMISRAQVIGYLRGVSEITIGTVMLLMLSLGAYEVEQGNLEPAQLAAIMGLLVIFTPSLRSLGRINEYWHAARVSQEKIEQFLALGKQPQGKGRLAGPLRRNGGIIKLKSVKLYGRLRSVSGIIEAGQKLAIIGPNGAGKSSLMQLIVRLTDADSGQISIAGRSIEKLALMQLRKKVSMVSPDLPLLRGSIRRNLLYRNHNANEEELSRVIELCEMTEWLNSLPYGVATRIMERGNNLSSGEQQRLMLARALMGNPSILLLDEPELNIDPENRRLFQRIINEFQGTLIIATHDIQFAAMADTVWYMDKGKIIEKGAPDLLLNSGKFTAPFLHGGEAA